MNPINQMAHDHLRYQTSSLQIKQSQTLKSSTLSHLHLGSWNVRSCQHPDKLVCILNTIMYTELHLCVLCETWMDSKADTDQFEQLCAQNGFSTFSSIRTRRTGGGVSVVFKNDLLFSAIKASNSPSHNYLWIHTRIDGRNLYFLCTYIPPSTSKQADFDTFLTEINQDISIFSRSGEILILGDLNLKVGNLPHTFEHKNTHITLLRSLISDATDMRGKQFISFTNAHKLVVINGVGNHANTYTYEPIQRSNTKHKGLPNSILDYVVCSYDVLHKLSPLRVWPLSTIQHLFNTQHVPPDHTLISTKLSIHDIDMKASQASKHQPRSKLATFWNRNYTTPGSNNQWRMYREIISRFCTEIQQRIDSPWFQNINMLQNTLVDKILDAGRLSGVLRTTLLRLNVTTYSRPQYPPSIQEALRLRNDALTLVTLYQYEASYVAAYRQAQNKVKREFRTYYLEKEQEMCMELDETRLNEVKQYWRVIQRYYSPFTPRPSTNPSMLVFQGKEYRGPELLARLSQEHKTIFTTNPTDAKFDVYEYQRCVQHVAEEEQRTPKPVNPSPLLEENFSWEEVERVIKNMKRHKACDKDNICAEALIHGGSDLQRLIHHLCRQAWSEEKIPDAWRESGVIHIHKGGETSEHKNWRPISIISVLSKVYLELLRERLEAYVESKNILPDEQYAFRKNRGCEDCVFLLHSFLQNSKPVSWTTRHRPRWESLMVLLRSRDQRFRVFRTGLWSKLLKYGITGKIWRVLRDIYRNSKSSILLVDEFGLPFVTEEGLRQGCLLSTLLFSLYIADLVITITEPNIGIQLHELRLTMTKFADDITLYAQSIPELQRLVDILVEYCYVNRMEISVSKTKAMYFTFGPIPDRPPITVYNQPVVRFWSTEPKAYLALCLSSASGWKNSFCLPF